MTAAATAKGAEMTEFTIARNDKTTAYEVHKQGCRHTAAKHMEAMVDVTAASGAEAAEQFEAQNDGILATAGPCVR